MKVLRVALALGAMAAAVGCGVQGGSSAGGPVGASLTGRVHGGQQPVANATIQLYAVGTGGDGSAATPLLTQAVTTDGSGSFSLSPGGVPLYSCTNATEVYLVATQGNPGGNGVNPNLAMMTALGPCSALTTSGFIWVNELTTVAAVEALSPYMTGYASVGSGTGDAAALASAFALAGELVNPSNGTTPGMNVPSGYTVPVATLNTLADIVAACVNSTGGVATDTSTNCGELFSLTTPQGKSAPTDTIGALLYEALNPTLNTGGLYGMVSANPPFQPTLAGVPPAFLPGLTPPPSDVQLQVVPSALTFGPVNVGFTASQTVYLQNISKTSAVTFSGITVGGTNASQFSASSGCGSSLAATSTSISLCAVTVTYAPTTTGAATAYLMVSSSTASSPQYVGLSGTATAGSLQPKAVLSGSVPQLPGLTGNVTLSNTGTAVLTISGISLLTPYYTQTNNCGASLAPGASCTIAVTNMTPYETDLAIPTPPGSFSNSIYDQLTVDSNDPSGETVMVIPPVSPSSWTFPANLDFPSVVVGSSATTTINYSTAYRISVVGPSDFTVNPNTCSITTTPICTATVTFTPTAAGTRTGEITFFEPGGGVSESQLVSSYVPIVGVGASAAPSSNGALIPASVQVYPYGGTQAVTLYNYGLSAINIQSIGVSTGFAQTNNCGSSLYGQSICTISVSTPTTIQGGIQGLLTVVDDLGTYTTSLSSLLGAIADFGHSQVGVTSPFTDPFLVPVMGSVSYFTGYNSGGFAAPACLGRATSCSSTMTFTPTAVGLSLEGFQLTNSSTPSTVMKGMGTGVGPDVTFAPGVGVYGYEAFNTGSTTLNFSGANGLTLTGPDAVFLQPSSSGICGVLAPQGSCNMQFAATGGYGVLHVMMTLTDATSGAQFTQPLVTPAPTFVQLPYVQFPTTLINSVSAAMPITTQLSGSQFGSAVVTGDPADYTLTKSTCSPSENPCVLQVVFHPVELTGFSGQGPEVMITPSVRTITPEIALLIGQSMGLGFGSVTPSSVSYATRPAGTTSVPVTVTLTNTGTAYLAASSLTLTGPNMGEFSIQPNTCASVAPNASCTIGVSFAPLTTGYKTATLVIAGDTNTNLPLSVTLAGTAD